MDNYQTLEENSRINYKSGDENTERIERTIGKAKCVIELGDLQRKRILLKPNDGSRPNAICSVQQLFDHLATPSNIIPTTVGSMLVQCWIIWLGLQKAMVPSTDYPGSTTGILADGSPLLIPMVLFMLSSFSCVLKGPETT